VAREAVQRPRAADDIADQAAWYVADAGPGVAERFLAAVRRATETLLDMPGMGAAREDAPPAPRGLRMVPVRGFERHPLSYLPTDGGVEIVRVLHGARDVPGILRDEEG
jgi:toxin ParE1/3/4